MTLFCAISVHVSLERGTFQKIMQLPKKQLVVAAIQFLRENGYTAGGRRRGEVSGEQASFENRQIRVPTGRLTMHPKKRG